MNRAPRVGPPTQVGYATRGVSLLNEALCWEKPGRALQVGNPHLTFPRPGKRQGPKFHPRHQPQHLQEAPLNRLLNESMRLISERTWAAFSTQTHQDLSFPSQASLGTCCSEMLPVSGLGLGVE